MLEVEGISIRRGGAPVLEHVSLRTAPGEVLAVTGPNGAGKTSLIGALAGALPVAEGRILWEGADITALPLHCRDGIALVPEGRLLAASLTVAETLRLGAGRISGKERAARLADVLDRLPHLTSRLDQPAGTLSGGEAQMLSLGRALMSGPRLLLLDEPSLGLSPLAARDMFATLAALRSDGMALLIADQDSRAAAALADRTLALGRAGSIARPSILKETCR